MRNDAINEVEDNIPSQNSILINYNYDSSNTLIATFNSISDTNQFCNNHNHDNNYNGLKLGQRIQINDGTYNKIWYIAGFDCEYNNVASDCTIKNNGYGICLVPTTSLISAQWNPTNTTSRGYYGSSIHNLCNTTIGPNLKYILGSHLITRNVLITNSVTNNGSSVNYTWSTTNCILLNKVAIEGTYLTSDSKVKYNTGELSYQLPIFRFISRYFLNGTWLRSVSSSAGSTTADYVGSYASITNDLTSSIHSVFPLIYIR